VNEQAIEKSVEHPEGLLDVHSIFYTIQGEGPFSGFPAVFIRLAGCNLQCPGCDTEYTQGRRFAHPEVVAQYVNSLSLPGGLVVITGGEPFRQNLTKLLGHLDKLGHLVQVESNGTLPPSEFDYSRYPRIDHFHGVYIVCSPKTGRINNHILYNACCLKYVLDADSMNPEDGLPIRALGHTANPQLARPPSDWTKPIYLQPMDSKNIAQNFRNIQAVVQSCMKFGYKLQLQIHKYIGMD
jgi:7-carboxy-7-deazaguanine synthase